MNEEELIRYYNKFNENKRLSTKHGRVEFLTAMKYIKKYLKKGDYILDIGAGTGAYSIPFSEMGHEVTAVELVKHNLREIEKKSAKVKTILGNAINLGKIQDASFDIVLLFGPMYHLISMKEKRAALEEAKRVTKIGGHIFISYCMNEYAVITHAFKEGFILESKEKVDKDYHVISSQKDLYSYVRINEIKKLSDQVGLKRIQMVAQDGPTEYLKKEINKMDLEEFKFFLQYHFKTCEDEYLIGASRHVLDILKKES